MVVVVVVSVFVVVDVVVVETVVVVFCVASVLVIGWISLPFGSFIETPFSSF